MHQDFEKIYRQLAPLLVKFIAKRMGADKDTVQEIFSQTMIAAWKGFTTFRHKSSYFTWICRIALNKIADYYRSQFHAKSTLIAPLMESLVEPGALSLEEQIVLNELKTEVAKWLLLLPESTRRVLQLRYWQDATTAEIGKILGISPKAVEGKLYRARKAMASVVAKAGRNG